MNMPAPWMVWIIPLPQQHWTGCGVASEKWHLVLFLQHAAEVFLLLQLSPDTTTWHEVTICRLHRLPSLKLRNCTWKWMTKQKMHSHIGGEWTNIGSHYFSLRKNKNMIRSEREGCKMNCVRILTCSEPWEQQEIRVPVQPTSSGHLK